MRPATELTEGTKADNLEPFEPETIVVGDMVKMVSDPRIEYTNRQAKERKIQQMKDRFLNEMKEKITSARQAYTKVMEEKAKYRFGYDEIQNNNRQVYNFELFSEQKTVHKPSIHSNESQFAPLVAQVRLPQAKNKRGVQIQEKKYDFKNITEFIYFNKEPSKQDKTKQLRLRDIEKLNNEQEFQQNYQNYQLSFQILQLFRELNNTADDPDEDKDVQAGKRMVKADREMKDELGRFNFRISRNPFCILFGNRSRNFEINYLKHLVINKPVLDTDKVEYLPLDMPQNVNDIDCNEITYLAAGRYGRKQAQKLEQISNTRRMNVKMLEGDSQLDKRYADLKNKINELKKARNISKTLVKVSQAAQTEKIVGDESLNELIDINTQRTLTKLGDLMKVKEEVTANIADYPSELRTMMFDDVHREMREQLFCLLMAILKDESFVNYSECFKNYSRQEVEDKLLEVIYYNINAIREKLTRSKESKLNLLNLYLNNRKMIKDYEESSRNVKTPQNPLSRHKNSRSKSPTPKKKIWL